MHGADFLVVGAGIIGVSVALELRRRHGVKVLVIDKEWHAGEHASGRNSGVLHAGVYYKAGSLKARFCVEGNRRLRTYCESKKIPINAAGKVIIAQGEKDVPSLEELHLRGTANGVRVGWLNETNLREVEPCALGARKALYVQDTAVVDPLIVMEALVCDAVKEGVEFAFGCQWLGVGPDREARTTRGPVRFAHLVNCAGLHADRVAHAFGVGTQYKVLPFRGGYYQLRPSSSVRVRGNIYPVPDLRNPFLGVHFTRQPDGKVTVGPNALPLAGREQYVGLKGATLADASTMVWYLARLSVANADHFRSLAWREMMKILRRGFYWEAARLVTGLKLTDLIPGKKPGIRAQLVNTLTGELVQDFLVESGPHSTHVLNAVSPGFTCALPFAEHVVNSMKPGA